MKISASDVRIGNLIEHQGKLWRVLKKEHVKPGKGGAFVQLELKESNIGTKMNERFRSEDKIEKARVEPRQMQYLYPDGGDYIFMDLESYEQVQLSSDVLVSQEGFLLPNEEVQINFYNEQPIGVELPATVALEVAETETVVKARQPPVPASLRSWKLGCESWSQHLLALAIGFESIPRRETISSARTVELATMIRRSGHATAQTALLYIHIHDFLQ